MPIIFAETRQLAQEWTYRFLAASRLELSLAGPTSERLDDLPGAKAPAPLPPKPAVVRAWARDQGLDVPARGKLRSEILEAYLAATVTARR